ncbi:alpha/beta hydrolase family protein [Nocardia nova SH22a]|uniref:Alpha/beta hydrolase family protein n=1 Tax=Nocardia nova SH22a TaxID=1415166 RepID=W5THD4_9NOCA|nr:alpha/beta fold hydrolase [Nocardia nova]AHH18627.1 alpha/beta hydrolase family protein [Nocardia nova SH22a]
MSALKKLRAVAPAGASAALAPRDGRPEEIFAAGERAPGQLRNPRLPYRRELVETADGATLHVRSYGPADAPPIVFAHGFGGRLEYWNPQIRAFADSHRVIAFDQRGHGRSGRGRRRFTVPLLGEDLAAVLAHMLDPGERAVIVGHSMGGIGTLSWAQGFPADVAARAAGVLLANTCATNVLDHTELIPRTPWNAPVRAALLRTFLASQAPSLPAVLDRALVRRKFVAPSAPAELVEFVHAITSTCPNVTRGRWGAALLDFDVTAAAGSLTVPTTVLTGQLDLALKPSGGRGIAAAAQAAGRECRYVEVPGAGHCSNLEIPAVFDREVLRLCEAHADRSGRGLVG